MFPTRTNFPGRCSNVYTFCNRLDTDEHLFKCCGYVDLIIKQIDYDMFFKLDADIEKLNEAAKILLNIHDRLEVIQNDADMRNHDNI